MKQYKLYSEAESDIEKGMLNDIFLSFVGNADSLFSLLTRSIAYRHRSPEGTFERNYKFVIYDKNPRHIAMFKHMLEWDGLVETPEDFDALRAHIDRGKKKFNIPVSKDAVQRIGKLSRRGFADFTYAWNCFKNSSFEFIEIDVINNNKEFVAFLYNLNNIKIDHRQFVKLDFNKSNYTEEVYNEAINNILHILWMKSFKDYQTVVELSNDHNISYEDFAGKLYTKLNPTFCVLPWMHIQYKPSGQSKLCCRYDNTKENKDYNLFLETPGRESDISELFKERASNLLIQKTSIEDNFNSNYWDTARKLTLQNKPISGCDKCYKEEQVPGEVATSMRLGSSILYNDGYLHKKPKFEKPAIEFLEVGFGNYCNLACLSCNSTLSTTWHDDELKLNDSLKDDSKLKRDVFKKLDNLKFEPNEETLKSLNLIKFTGGEPMINPEFVKFIDLICDKGYPENISLEIYTNCSYIPSPKLLTNLKKFKNIQLNLSIDAYGSVNDYIRYGSVWQGDGKQTVSNSLDFWLAQGVTNKNINVIMSSTLSILNVFDIPELITWWMDKFKESGNTIIVHRTSTLPSEYEGFFKLQMAFDPSYIGMNILPKEYYSEIVQWTNKYMDEFIYKYPDLEFVPESIRASLIKLNNAVDRSKGDPKNAKLFLEYLERMDKIRNNSASESIPVVVSKIKEYLLTQDTLQQN